MDFVLSEEQKLLRDSLHRFFAAEYPFEKRQQVVRERMGFSAKLWQAMAELGVLAIPFDVERGGFGGLGVDSYIAFEAMGKALACEPAISTLALGACLLNEGGSSEQQEEMIPAIIAGELIVAVGFYEPQSRFNLANVQTTADKIEDGYVINGTKSVVYAAPQAKMIFISARTSEKTLDQHGVSIFAIDVGASGIDRRDYPTVDGFSASELCFDAVHVGADALVGIEGKGFALAEHAVDTAVVACCAEAVGNMEALIERTLEHCKTREAFGQPISNFQVIQHRLVDMQVAYEHAAAITMRAAKLLKGVPVERSAAAAAAKVQVNKEAEFVGTNAVQLHGAMGMTEELDIGHFFKRLVALGSSFGDTNYSIRRYMQYNKYRDRSRI